MLRPLTPFIALGALLLAGQARAQSACEVDRVWPLGATDNALFGKRLAHSGKYVVVGAPLNDDTGPDAGAAYVLEEVDGTFVQRKKFTPPSSDYGQRFGQAVDIDGDRILVGSQDNQAAFSAGAGFLYRRQGGNWVLDDTLFGDTPFHAGGLGVSVAIEGTRAAIGGTGLHADEGYVLVFEEGPGGWSEVAELTPQGGHRVFGFGSTVELRADRILVGANASGGDPAVYVFERDPLGWTQTVRLVGQGAKGLNGYAHDIALGDDLIVHAFPHGNPGRALVYRMEGGRWVESTPLLGSGDPLIDFGGAVDLRGDRIAVGGVDNSPLGIGKDYVEVFRREGLGWVPEDRISSPNPGNFRNFGEDVALWGDGLIVGMPQDSKKAPFGGALHLWNLGPHAIEFCASTPNSTGAAAVTTVPCSTDIHTLPLRAAPVPDRPGLFFLATGTAYLPAWDGVLCLGGGIARLPVVSGAQGTLAYDLDLESPIGPGLWVQAGSTWHLQAWFRDTVPGGSGANLSSGLRIDFAP